MDNRLIGFIRLVDGCVLMVLLANGLSGLIGLVGGFIAFI